MQRFRGDEEERLSPEEAREFLAVYSERNAEVAENADDSPRLSDVSELLGIDRNEAARILTEARQRVQRREAQPSVRRARKRLLLPVICAAALLASLGLVVHFGSGPGTARRAIEAPEPATVAPAEGGPPEGFDVVVNAPVGDAVSIEASGAPARFGTDFSSLSESEALAIRRGLTRSVVSLVDQIASNQVGASSLRKVVLSLRIQGGQWVRFGVKLAPFTLPLENNPRGRADITRRVQQAIDGNWAAIVRQGPK